jgi:hypothetical protein
MVFQRPPPPHTHTHSHTHTHTPTHTHTHTHTYTPPPPPPPSLPFLLRSLISILVVFRPFLALAHMKTTLSTTHCLGWPSTHVRFYTIQPCVFSSLSSVYNSTPEEKHKTDVDLLVLAYRRVPRLFALFTH